MEASTAGVPDPEADTDPVKLEANRDEPHLDATVGTAATATVKVEMPEDGPTGGADDDATVTRRSWKHREEDDVAPRPGHRPRLDDDDVPIAGPTDSANRPGTLSLSAHNWYARACALDSACSLGHRPLFQSRS